MLVGVIYPQIGYLCVQKHHSCLTFYTLCHDWYGLRPYKWYQITPWKLPDLADTHYCTSGHDGVFAKYRIFTRDFPGPGKPACCPDLLKNRPGGSLRISSLQKYIVSIYYHEYLCCYRACLLYTSPSPRDVEESRMPSSA